MKAIRVSEPSGNNTPGGGLNTFRCAGCGERRFISLYAVAQCAMGHTLIDLCGCGQRHTIAPRRHSYRVETIPETSQGEQSHD